MELNTIIASAGTAAVVSGIFLLLGGWIERRHRAKELVFGWACKMAKERTELIKEVANKTGGMVSLRDNAFLAEEYYGWLIHLFDKGKLPPEALKAQEDGRKGGNQS
jgi:hypothetical protein